MDEKFLIFVVSIIIGFVIGHMFCSERFNDKYVSLRTEIIQKTNVDITYPEGTCKMNDTFYNGEINLVSCKK